MAAIVALVSGAAPIPTGSSALHLPLDAPEEQGATGTLRRHPFLALQTSPSVAGFGDLERRALLEAADGGPDGWLLWERVRVAAAQAA